MLPYASVSAEGPSSLHTSCAARPQSITPQRRKNGARVGWATYGAGATAGETLGEGCKAGGLEGGEMRLDKTEELTFLDLCLSIYSGFNTTSKRGIKNKTAPINAGRETLKGTKQKRDPAAYRI